VKALRRMRARRREAERKWREGMGKINGQRAIGNGQWSLENEVVAPTGDTSIVAERFRKYWTGRGRVAGAGA
jgi:hypothetical protein